MANCSDNVYVIKYTDKSKGTITITKSSLVTNLVDIALVGKSRLDYGEVFNENILHLLENFACPSGENPDAPDTLVAFGTILSNPISGQKWYNSTSRRLYVYNATQGVWVAQNNQGDVAANSGVIAHGEFLPRPVGKDGYVFPYSECNFVVSQQSSRSVAADNYLPPNTEIDYMRCYVESNGKVTMQFRYRGESALRFGYANYQIIGIRGESNTPLISVTPYAVPTPTPGVSATITPTPTPTTSSSPAPTNTPTRTPSTTPQPTPTGTATPTPTVSVTRTPGASVTPSRSVQPSSTPGASVTPTPSVSPTISVSASPAASATPTPGPSSTPAASVTPSPTPAPPSATPTMTVTPSPVYTIDLSGIPSEVDDLRALVASWASLNFYADGTWNTKLKEQIDNSGIWASSGIGSNYELRIDSQSGNYPQGTTGVWYDLGSGYSFYVQDANTGTTAFQNVTYTIRNKSNFTDAMQAGIMLSADGECFAVGTQVAVPGGLINVEDLSAGDVVTSYTHATMIDESDENWRNWETTENEFILGNSTVTASRRFFATDAISINGLVTTRNHIHMVFDGEVFTWKNACDVTATDKLVDVDGELVDILNITELTGETEFVALDVETDDTLIVYSNDKLILSHNASA